MSLMKRMRRLNELLWIRCGPGSVLMPKEISKLSLEFNAKIYKGNGGARKFWREMLPRIKYRNPSISITVSRHMDSEGPCVLHIYTQAPESPIPSESESTPPIAKPTHTFSMRDLGESEILSTLMAHTGAVEVAPSPQDRQNMAELEEFKKQSEADRILVREKFLAQRREEQLLKMAKTREL